MKTCKEIAIEWGLSERTVVNLCKNGKIVGAYKKDNKWQITLLQIMIYFLKLNSCLG